MLTEGNKTKNNKNQNSKDKKMNNDTNNNRIEVTARCIHIGPIQTFPSGFTKRTIAVEWTRDGAKFPTKLAFDLKKDQTAEVNETYLGKTLKVSGFVESREWVNPKNNLKQFFTEISVGKVSLVDAATEADTSANDTITIDASETDDLPF